MALLGLKMALIHPKKVQIGYKLDQNTNLVNTFENNRRKCKKVKIQWNMKDFHWKISIRCWKSRFVKNHEKRNNSSPDSPIWLIFGYVGPYNQWNRFLCQNFDIFIFQRNMANFQQKMVILADFCWKFANFRWKMKNIKILTQKSVDLDSTSFYPKFGQLDLLFWGWVMTRIWLELATFVKSPLVSERAIPLVGKTRWKKFHYKSNNPSP